MKRSKDWKTNNLQKWIVPIAFDGMGKPVGFGMRSFPVQFRESEALERLDAILECDNDDDWKQQALQAMPFQYWLLALRSLEYSDHVSDHTDSIAAIDPDLNNQISSNWRTPVNELQMRLLEEREGQLAAESIVVSEEAARIKEEFAERKKAKDILAQLRTPSKED